MYITMTIALLVVGAILLAVGFLWCYFGNPDWGHYIVNTFGGVAFGVGIILLCGMPYYTNKQKMLHERFQIDVTLDEVFFNEELIDVLVISKQAVNVQPTVRVKLEKDGE